MTKCGIMPMCSLFLSLGSVAVQKRASRISWPNEEHNRSAICNSTGKQRDLLGSEIRKKVRVE